MQMECQVLLRGLCHEPRVGWCEEASNEGAAEYEGLVMGVVMDHLEALWRRSVYGSGAVGNFDILPDFSRGCLSAIIRSELNRDIAITYVLPFFAMSLTSIERVPCWERHGA